MVLRIDIGGLPPGRLRFAASPLAELTAMLHVWQQPGPLRRAVAAHRRDGARAGPGSGSGPRLASGGLRGTAARGSGRCAGADT
ncbi:DUF5937 family protein [Planomonospora parontospora]|uniref:DUF5937 family protein n=1 Tax=Planomonospora parontospora TaxID=58119 RepID=UPI001EF42200|nr:DUF5937 family protein [Planomonospora parontospora]